MGFYGKIANTNKTQFTFDKIYPNRKKMDEECEKDNVFVGRFILVEYEPETPNNYYNAFFKNGNYYKEKTSTNEADQIIEPIEGTIIRVKESNGSYSFYIADDKEIWQSKNMMYQINYNIDTKKYGSGRGYDSTVWQKTSANGVFKYVMIAELNTIVPQFRITADAPTMNPVAPHFDENSTNALYWLHVQPQWGLRIKENEQELSDEIIQRVESIYDENSKVINNETKNINGAIFYNKDGFSQETQSYSDEKDYITVLPTGKSGLLYDNHQGGLEEKEDIQEISIILPSIGNTVAKLWDLAYGDNIDANKKRNLDIKWNSLKGNRLVVENGEGNGFQCIPSNVESIAGCINSVHDLMGMIIEDYSSKNPIATENLDTNKIYYNKDSGTYNRRFINYKKGIVAETNSFVKPQYKEIGKLVNWNSGEFFTRDVLNNYFLVETENAQKLREYYKLKPIKETLSGEYKENTYWYWMNTGNGSYIKDTGTTASHDLYYTIEDKEESKLFYVPNHYWYAIEKDPVSGKAKKVAKATGDFNKNLTYYYISGNYEIDDVLNPETGEVYQIPNGGIIKEIKLDGYDSDLDKEENRNNAYYFKVGDNYERVKKSSLPVPEEGATPEAYTYYKLTVTKANKFYRSGIYHYQTKLNKKDYLKDDIIADFDENKDYYTINENDIVIYKYFYKPNQYYYYDNETKTYKLDDSLTATKDRIYYKLEEYYVFEDNTGMFNIGSEWNQNIKVPSGVVVATKIENIELQELKGFARDFNTIHGLILRLNELLDSDESNSRNLDTIQGSINKLNDIIIKFNELKPNKILMVDEYGRIKNETLGELPLGYTSPELGIEESTTLGEIIDKVVTTVEPVTAYNERIEIIENELEKVIPIEKGGTGVITLEEARQKFNFIGTPGYIIPSIASEEEDTPAYWATLGTGVAYINNTVPIKEKPSIYGFIDNKISNSGLIHQVWHGQFNDGKIRTYHRTGNSNDWYQKILNEDNTTYTYYWVQEATIDDVDAKIQAAIDATWEASY